MKIFEICAEVLVPKFTRADYPICGLSLQLRSVKMSSMRKQPMYKLEIMQLS